MPESMNPYEARAWKDYARRFKDEVVPKIDASAITMMMPGPVGDFDVQQATELGAMILMDKPIIVVAEEGQKISGALERAATKVIRGDITSDVFRDQLAAEIAEATDGGE